MPLPALLPWSPLGTDQTPNGLVGYVQGTSGALNWLAATVKGQDAVAKAEAAGPTFGELADEWLAGVHTGAVGRRRGRKGTGYSPTTLEGYERSLSSEVGQRVRWTIANGRRGSIA
jgi:hypothetical protein